MRPSHALATIASLALAAAGCLEAPAPGAGPPVAPQIAQPPGAQPPGAQPGAALPSLPAVPALPALQVEPVRAVRVVAIKEHTYEPAHLTIAPGTTVRFVNEDVQPHTATADDVRGWGTRLLKKGESAEHTFETTGVHPYHCEPHPWMKATIEVK